MKEAGSAVGATTATARGRRPARNGYRCGSQHRAPENRRADSPTRKSRTQLPRARAAAFTLLEVLIAMGIFFMAVFAILQLTSQNLRLARALKQDSGVDASSLAAELSLTNTLDEGFSSGDFGELHPGYSWAADTYAVGTNGLFQVDFTVIHAGARPPAISQMSVYLWRPASVGRPPGAVGGAVR